MKYLLSAASILAALCLGLLIAPVLTPRPQPIEGSLVINQKIYQPKELEKRLRNTPYYFENKGDLLTDLIYRELLLQEAKTEQINTETAFLDSMRDFYEQSMIKTLLDRQYKSETHQPSNAQVSACLPFLASRFQISRFSYPDRQAAQDNRSPNIQKVNSAYLDLPEDMRGPVLELKGGALSMPLHSENGWYRLQLTNITPLKTTDLPAQIEQDVLCRTELQRQSIHNWIESLYHKSTIKIPSSLSDNGKG
ncbi:MAG: hypothetical protein L3J63_03230 [Geopsychrobacter sp.]|nr:hypothetical protein [Geopsychrobacter sp.]